MTKLKATPGPWHIGGAHGVIVYAGDGYAVASCATYHGRFTNEEAERNSNLIAAAPDLYEALNEIVKSLSDQDDEGMIEHAQQMIDARLALSKARGES